jgi:hypothetical protein
MRTAVDTKPMTPEEAALQMELLGHDFPFLPTRRLPGPQCPVGPDDGNLGLLAAAG